MNLAHYLALPMSRQAAGGAGPAGPATFTMTQLPSANRVYQRSTKTGGGQSKGQGSVPVTINATVAGTIYARCRSAADGVTILQSSFLAGTITGTGSQTFNAVGVDARLGWFYLDLSGDGATWTNGTTAVGMGALIAASGQSLMIRMVARFEGTDTNSSLGVTINPNGVVYATTGPGTGAVNTATWTLPADGGKYNSTGASELLNRMVNASGVNCAFVGHSWGQTSITEWVTGGGQVASLRARLSEVGGFEAFIWFQGHSDSLAGMSIATYQGYLDQLFADVATYTSVPFAKVLASVPNINSGAWGTALTINNIRRAASDWATANSGVYVQPADLDLVDGVHQTQAGAITVARHFYRALRPHLGLTNSDAGPVISSASRSGVDITLGVTLSPGATALVSASTTLVALAARFSVQRGGGYGVQGIDFNETLDATTPITIGANSITLKLAADPGSEVPLSVFFARPTDTANPGQANMIWDDSVDGDGLTQGRQLTVNLIEIGIAAPVPNRDLTMFTPTYAPSMTGFGQSSTFGYGLATGARTPLPPFTIEMWVKKAANPAAIVVFGGEAGAAYFGCNTDGRALAVYNYSNVASVYITASALNNPAGNTLPVITDGLWHHLSMTVTPTGGYCHVDGVLQGTSSQVPRMQRTRTAAPGYRRLGGGSSQIASGDTVDDYVIYNATVRPLANFTPPSAPTAPSDPGVFLLWNIDGNGANSAP